MKYAYGIIIFITLLSVSCGMTVFVGEPPFVQYPFQELTRFSFTFEPDDFMRDMHVFDVETGSVLFTVDVSSATDDLYYFWNGDTLLTANFPGSRTIINIIPLPGMKKFATLEVETNYYFGLYSVLENGDGTAQFTLVNERLFDTAEFPGLPGGYIIGELQYAGGRLYGTYDYSITEELYVLSYAVDETGFSDPKIDLSPLAMSAVDTELFSAANEIVQSSWINPLPESSSSRYFAASSSIRCIFSKQLNTGGEQYWTAADWDGSDLTGELAVHAASGISFAFLMDGSFLEMGWDQEAGQSIHRIRNLGMEEIGIIKGLPDITYISDALLGEEHVLFYYFWDINDAGNELSIIYLPLSSVTGG